MSEAMIDHVPLHQRHDYARKCFSKALVETRTAPGKKRVDISCGI